jgi:hypothetical protein
MENAWANDKDRYVLEAQPGRVAGAARKSKRALTAHRPKRPAQLRSPQQEPLSQVTRYYAAGPTIPAVRIFMPRAGAARLDRSFARMQHCSGPARSARAAMPPQRHRGDRFSRERHRAVTAPRRPTRKRFPARSRFLLLRLRRLFGAPVRANARVSTSELRVDPPRPSSPPDACSTAPLELMTAVAPAAASTI